MIAREIIEFIESRYPLDLQEEWDHSGLQCGDINQEVHKVMIALDADLRTLKEAIEQGCDMLMTHHPFLFNTLTLDLTTPVGQFIQLAIEHHVLIYSSHTPLDHVDMNEWLIKQLDVFDITTIEETGIARQGCLNAPLSFDDFIQHIKKAYHINTLRVAGQADTITTVAVCGGSGGSFIDEVAPHVDAYITGDLKYHDGQKAFEQNIILVDIGHHAEVIMVNALADYLSVLPIDVVTSTSPDYYSLY